MKHGRTSCDVPRSTQRAAGDQSYLGGDHATDLDTEAGSLLVLAAGLFVLSAARPPRVVKISGSAELTYAKREMVPVSGKEGHVFLLGETRGINKNTGSSDYFGDAEV